MFAVINHIEQEMDYWRRSLQYGRETDNEYLTIEAKAVLRVLEEIYKLCLEQNK